MTIPRANTLDDVVKRLHPLLQQRPDIAWARFRLEGPEEKSSIVKLIVMPTEPWWSRLEREALAREVEKLLGRIVELEDERAVHPRCFEEFREKWKLLIDRDVIRRLDTQSDRSSTWLPISEVQRDSDNGPATWGPEELADRLQSSAITTDSEKSFKQIVEFAFHEELFGPDFFDEDSWDRISNAAQEAGRRVLALCCDVISLHYMGGPRSTTDALGFFADHEFLDSDCAVRLADWLSYALPREFPVKTDRKRVRCLLAIRADDLNKFCDAVSRAAASRKETKDNAPPAELLAFDLQAALVGLTELMEQTNDKAERELLSHIKSAVLKRRYQGRSIEELRSDPEGVFAQSPVASLLVFQDSAFDPLFPRRIAHALYGDASLVYNIGEVLDADAQLGRFDAVWGRSTTYQPIGIESLPEFVQSNGQGVVFFQDAHQADPRHLSLLSHMAEAYLRDPAGQRIFVGNTCLIVGGRFPIGTPREIDFHGSQDDDPRYEFCWHVEADAASRSPEHLSTSICSRFSVSVERIWARYLQLVASGSLDEPLVPRSSIARVERTPRSERSPYQVEDLSRLIRVTPEPGKFDFFVSYSWTRTRSQAHELVALLKSRGHNVFFDKDKLRGEASMEELIPELVYAVRSSRAVLLFPIQLKEPITDLVGDEDVELRHGRAIRAPAGLGTVLAEWSWQTLELLAAGHHLVVEQHRAYAIAHERLDPDFITRSYRSVEELADVCESYLDLRHQQGVG